MILDMRLLFLKKTSMNSIASSEDGIVKVETRHINSALVSISYDPNQIITLDANFIIPPDRQAFSAPSIPFQKFREIWLNPIFDMFSALAIHEAVHDELVSVHERSFIQEMLSKPTPKIIIHKDSLLDPHEHVLRNTIEQKISQYTKYDPCIDNANDKGEVKTLSYIAVKNLPYFATNDTNTVLLIEQAESLSTGLDDVQVIKMYELIYLLYRTNPSLQMAGYNGQGCGIKRPVSGE